MTGGNFVLALRSLCEIDPPEVTGQGIEESSDRSALASLFDLGALSSDDDAGARGANRDPQLVPRAVHFN